MLLKGHTHFLADADLQRVGAQEPNSTAQTAKSEGHRVSEFAYVKGDRFLSLYMLSTIAYGAALALMQID
jgi:hypothetical protein